METQFLSNPRTDLQNELLRQCIAMARYAFKQGKSVPGNLVETLSNLTAGRLAPAGEVSAQAPSNARQLADIHEQLSRIVAPASPITILLLEKEAVREGFWNFLGPVPLVRRLMGMAGIFFLFTLAISLSPEIGAGTSAGMFEGSGLPLLMSELFLVCTAGLGATFAALFQVNRYLTEGTFDPKYEPGYWIKFVLGLIAGFTLCELINLNPDASTSKTDLTRPMLAMVGGFSATVLYRILSRLTETVESLFQGSMKETIAVREQAAQARAAQQLSQDRLGLAMRLIEIQKVIPDNAPEAFRQRLDQALANLIPVEFNTPTMVPAANGSAINEGLEPSPQLAPR